MVLCVVLDLVLILTLGVGMVPQALVLRGRMVLQGIRFLDVDILSILTVPMVFLLAFS